MAIPLLEQPPAFERFLSEPRDGPFTHMALSGPFVQREPQDGEPARFETRVYAGYDRESLYFVFVCLDDEPHLVRSRLTRREGTADYEDEMVEVRLDTFDDRRRSYYFAANPHGVQLDALWPEVGGGFDESFDTVWYSRGQRTPWGFLVMFEIPFKSLRFVSDAEQSWGLYYGRWNPRLGEKSFWPPNTKRLRSQLRQMASVSGLRGISPGRNVQLIPYGSYRGFEVVDERDPSGPIRVRDLADATAGVDAKVVLKDTLSLDLTANPDFAQVESDAAQVTTNQRFEVFFPEKRPFFLENAGQFDTPLNLVFTRRIADPSLGARLTGKAGPWAIGAFAVDDQAPGELADPGSPLAGERAGIGIVRVSRDVFDQSSVGALYTERRLADGHNRVGGFDANLKLGRNWALELQAVTSSTRTGDGRERAGPAYHAELERRGLGFSYELEYEDIAEGFDTELGFVRRTGIRSAEQEFRFTRYPGGALNSVTAFLEMGGVWDRGGERLDLGIEPGLLLVFPRRSGVELLYRWRRERLRPGDAPGLDADADFAPSHLELSAWSSPIPQVAAGATVTAGRGINFNPLPGSRPAEGDYRSAYLELTLRPIAPLEIHTVYVRTTLGGPSGGRVFLDEILRSRWGWQLTRELSLRAILRYDRTRPDPGLTAIAPRRSLNADLLLTYLVAPGTALYVGYNHNARDRELLEDPPRLVPRDALRTDARQLFVKLSYLVRF